MGYSMLHHNTKEDVLSFNQTHPESGAIRGSLAGGARVDSRELGRGVPVDSRELSRGAPLDSRDLSREVPVDSRDLSRGDPGGLEGA